ncbi:MAG: Gfo/Idh/MocA family oxidoreductase, partial [Candidatus Omnitrophica bacterium]|nr:Gfo/Idh/MocA family oxidoreductase [Candidatus Omnitrophota bacterium]
MAAREIRTGIIRCDMHGMYYGALMEKHDPAILQRPGGWKSDTFKYSWQPGGAHFYFYTHYSAPWKITVPTESGFRLVKVWDESPEAAAMFSRVFYDKPEVCRRFEDVSDGVDLVLIADCNGDGSDHWKLASPGIKKGIPTFIDKPFAYDVGEARKLVALARKHRTPIMSTSLLGILPHVDYFKSGFGRIAPLHMGIVNGTGTTMAGHIHGISLAQHLFGKDAEWVEVMGDTPLE